METMQTRVYSLFNANGETMQELKPTPLYLTGANALFMAMVCPAELVQYVARPTI